MRHRESKIRPLLVYVCVLSGHPKIAGVSVQSVFAASFLGHLPEKNKKHFTDLGAEVSWIGFPGSTDPKDTYRHH